MKITEVAVDRPITTVMVFLIIVVVSAVSLTRLPIDLMPDVSYPALSVVVEYPGAAPEEIETLITRPIEEAMGSVSHVERLDTRSQEERSVVSLRFTWGSDLDDVADDVRQRLDRIRGALPDEVEPPVLFKYDFNMSPIIRYGLSANMDPVELRHLAEHDLKPRLERVAGVASVDVAGGFRREIQVNLIRDKIDALNLSPQAIVARIRVENLDLPAGEVTEGEIDLLVRTRGQFTSPGQLEQMVVATRGGIPIYLRDLAEIVDGFEEIRQVERVNGRPAITLSIVKESNGNTVQVANGVEREMADILREMPHLTIATLWDSSLFIKDAISSVRTAALGGAVLAILVLLIFLRNIRSTLIIASAIPVSVTASFSLL